MTNSIGEFSRNSLSRLLQFFVFAKRQRSKRNQKRKQLNWKFNLEQKKSFICFKEPFLCHQHLFFPQAYPQPSQHDPWFAALGESDLVLLELLSDLFRSFTFSFSSSFFSSSLLSLASSTLGSSFGGSGLGICGFSSILSPMASSQWSPHARSLNLPRSISSSVTLNSHLPSSLYRVQRDSYSPR